MKSVIHKPFQRWTPIEKSSWTSQVFKYYNTELDKNFASYILANKFAYTTLGKSGANWSDEISRHFTTTKQDDKAFNSLKSWSNSFNNYDKWMNLNFIMAISSNFETFLATVINLALQSDPGTLFGAPRSIDGLVILKRGTFDKLDYNSIIESITKGDWNSRLNAFKKIFGKSPAILETKMAELEQIRKIRNQVGHAFGRDISLSRSHAIKNIIEIETVSRERTLRYQRILWSCAKHIDDLLLKEHIGTFQFLLFYHNLFPTLNSNSHIHERANLLKKEIGRTGVATISKQFYRDLTNYYEQL